MPLCGHPQNGKSRELPLHQTTADALKAYAGLRDRLCPKPKAPSFLVSAAGTRLVYVTVQQVFSSLIRAAGITARPGARGPRLHDYADIGVMPTSAGSPCPEAVNGRKLSA